MKKLLLFISLLISALGFSQSYYLQCGKLIDTESGKVLSKMTVVVTKNTISDVLKGYVNPTAKADKVIDLKNKTVMPGLIDMHVHLEHEMSPKRYIESFTLGDVDAAFESTVYAKRTLLAGFTTVRDLGGSGVNTKLRNAIRKGYVIGPRIYSAGKAIGTTGGHADPTNGVRKELMGDPGPKEGVINSVDDARKAVRQRYKNGADVIKITATGGVLSVAKNGQNPQFTIPEIKSICSTAKDYNMIVAAHAHGDEGIRRAIIGGVNTIEHGTLMTEKTMDLMIAHGTYLVPTITAGKEVTEKAKISGFFPAIIVPKALAIGPKSQNTFAKAYKKGVKIAFGTDAGVFKHGENAREFVYMVEAGMPAMKAIQSATKTNAFVLKNNKLGVISKGNFADIIAVDGNPIKDISTMKKVSFVMKNGVVYKSE